MSAFRKYTREELVRFVRSLDLFIDEPTNLFVIGGAAAALEYGATGSTWTNVPRAVVQAAAEAREATGLAVPIEKAAVTDRPYHHEDRIRRAAIRLNKLRILVPERHDLGRRRLLQRPIRRLLAAS